MNERVPVSCCIYWPKVVVCVVLLCEKYIPNYYVDAVLRTHALSSLTDQNINWV